MVDPPRPTELPRHTLEVTLFSCHTVLLSYVVELKSSSKDESCNGYHTEILRIAELGLTSDRRGQQVDWGRPVPWTNTPADEIKLRRAPRGH